MKFLKLYGNLQINVKLEQHRGLGRKQGPWELFLEKVGVPGNRCLQFFTKA